MKKSGLLVLLLFTGLHAWCQADAARQAEAHIKTVYLYNFSKYVEWPGEYSSGNFVIGVVNGSSSLIAELNKMAASKTAGSQKFVVKNYQSVAEIDKCNILYVPENSNADLPEVLRKIRGFSTLLVTDAMGDAKKGAAINFVLRDSKQEFELNKSNAERCKLVVSSSLTALAIAKVD